LLSGSNSGTPVPPEARSGTAVDDVGPSSRAFLAELRREFPQFRIVAKSDSAFSRSIDVLLRLITLGGQREYMSRYHTVIGSVLYVPPTWAAMGDRDRVILLRHERIHLRQRRRLTFLGMAAIYLLPWFPLGLAYGRARLEWEAYTETLRATAELMGLSALRSPALREHIVRRFTGPDYGWMWPFRRQVEGWYAKAVSEIETEHSAGQIDPELRSG
jgi:hypothetical protein